MYDALDIWTWCIDRGMEGEAEFIDSKTDATSTDIQHVASHVNLRQAGCRHLMMQHAERRYQEVLVVLADAALKAFRPS